MTLHRTRMFRASASALASLTLGAASATAADVVVQPNAGSGLVVTDASGSQIRLRVNESGEVTIPVLVNGAQQNFPACVSAAGQLGPCASGAIGVGPQGPAGPAGPTGPQGPTGSGGFTLPYAGNTAAPNAAFSVTNTSGNGVEGASNDNSGVRGTSFRGYGVQAISIAGAAVHAESTDGDGVQGSSVSFTGVYGKSTGPKGGAGVLGESAAFDGVHGYTSSSNAVGVAGFADQGNSSGVLGVSKAGSGVVGVSTSGFGVFGHSDSNYAVSTDGPVQQSPNQGGWVKAMLHVDRPNGNLQGSQKILRCFNSRLAASNSSQPPCGLTLDTPARGQTVINFGFPVDSRFVVATLAAPGLPFGSPYVCPNYIEVQGLAGGSSSVTVSTGDDNCEFDLIVF